MLMTAEEASDYAHIMTEEGYKQTVAIKRKTWQETDCIPSRATRNYRDITKKGDLLASAGAMRQARGALTETDGAPRSDKNVCCHLCKNDSQARQGFICINPHHLYWGSRSDNQMDISPEARKARARAANALESTCPHCEKTGKGAIMLRYHFDRCKLKK